MELYLNSKISGKQTCTPLITEVAAIVQDDQGHETAIFETAPGTTGAGPSSEQAAAALQAFLDRYPKATLHAVHDDADQTLFLRMPWNLGTHIWGECVITAAIDVMERLDVDACRKSGRSVSALEAAARSFDMPSEGPLGTLAIARLGARLHAVVRERRATCDLEEDEATHMMEQGL
jgi:hypothetical protein